MNDDRIAKRVASKKIKKWIKIILLAAIVVFLLSFLLNKNFWDGVIMAVKTNVFLNNIEKKEKAYSEDSYGGKTPEETYQLFLSALKKKDIELASKYFVLDKQERYKKALNEVDQNGMWDLMMEDLLQTNIKKRLVGENSYVLEIFNDKDEFLTQIGFLLPTKTFDESVVLSEVWKIYSF